jgi:hypothetical protein
MAAFALENISERAPNIALHPTHLPATLPPAPLRSGDGSSTGKRAGECGVMRREEKDDEEFITI